MSQIFQTSFPKNDFFEFINNFCEKNNNQYIFSKEAFKRIKLQNSAEPFCEKLKKYYFKSKHHYLERDMNFIKFVTILRQLCNYLNVEYKMNTKYDKNTYNIIYYIKKL